MNETTHNQRTNCSITGIGVVFFRKQWYESRDNKATQWQNYA